MGDRNQADGTLRVLTANLYGERLDLEGFRVLLKDLDADVVLVQELSFRAADVLAEFLPHGLLVPAHGYDGRGLALKAPGHPQILPMAFRDGLIARLGPPAWPGSVEIVNIHMANPIVWPPWASLRLRRRQLDALMAHVSRPGVRLVGGDFNASPAWPVYRRLAAHLDDAAKLWAKQQVRDRFARGAQHLVPQECCASIMCLWRSSNRSTFGWWPCPDRITAVSWSTSGWGRSRTSGSPPHSVGGLTP